MGLLAGKRSGPGKWNWIGALELICKGLGIKVGCWKLLNKRWAGWNGKELEKEVGWEFINRAQISLSQMVSGRKSINGFTLDLIHRDSLISPYHDPSNTPSERLQKAFHRSFSRASFFGVKCVHSIKSTLTPNEGEFLMKISIGTPPIDTFVIADTGSDLTWTQCKPCVNCFKQLTPIFNPKNSSSYKTIGCHYKLCQGSLCNNNRCNYEVSYGDQSHSMGDLSIETFTFASSSGKHVSIPNIVFGCGHDNSGTFTNATSGIIGLGGGNASIVNQMHHEIKGKFSYCLIPLELLLDSSNATSHINFGDNAVVSGPNVISTPIYKKESPIFYYLNLKGISIGNKTVEFKSSPISLPGYDRGNIIIDSGTTLTYVPDVFYLNLESLLIRSINATRKDGTYGGLDLCYESNENGTIDVPKIVAHFTNADLELSTSNIFTQMEEGIVCLTIVPGGNQISILGNLAQANFLIGFDLEANKMSFKPTDCTKY
ncbi:aspartic proteinase CDR1 [Solanum tuberosum]|uniref:aspartic proteinase CDR1 n=1 Tax=Solanum tuberosum TaxID=4113 RepID=UPI00073A0BAC|nr:PREDICTED: aspartic proteinase CDR1 [Solanum tuberosum]